MGEKPRWPLEPGAHRPHRPSLARENEDVTLVCGEASVFFRLNTRARVCARVCVCARVTTLKV